MLDPRIKQIGSGQTGNGKSEINILGISKLKLTWMGELNPDDHYIYYCDKNPLEEIE